MLKLLILSASLLLGGVVAHQTTIPNTNNDINVIQQLNSSTDEKKITLYNGESLSIDSTKGTTISKTIGETEDKIELKISKEITFSNGGLHYTETSNKDRYIAIEVSKKYVITSINLTAVGEDGTIKLSEGYSSTDTKVTNTEDLSLTTGDSTSKEMITENKYIDGGKTYYFVSDTAATITKLDATVAYSADEIALPPVIVGPDKLDSKASNVLSKEDILSSYTATDSIDGECEVKIKHDTGYLMALETEKYGTYEITLTASDTAGNWAEKMITINYYDDWEDFLPVITGPSAIIKADNILLTLADIQELYSAKDYEQHVIDLKVVNVNYLKSANKVGTYKVKVVATDAKERTKELAVQVRVVDKLKDMWYVDPQEVYTTQYSKLTVEQLVNEYSRFKGLDVYNFELEEDNYSDMVDIPGTYTIKVLISTGEGLEHIEFKVHVDEHAVLVKPATRSIWDHIGSFFRWIWNGMCSWFK